MSEKNQARKIDNECKPEFEPGDLLLVWEKASAESRLKSDIRRLEGDKGGLLPGKLRNPWQEPFRMLRCSGERNCVIELNGKEEEFNVNRLTKQCRSPRHVGNYERRKGSATQTTNLDESKDTTT